MRQGSRLAAAAVTVLATGFATFALAAAKGPATRPPPPQGASYEAAKQWVDDYIARDGYVLASLDESGVLLFDPATVEVDGTLVRAIVRGEKFKPERIQDVAQRSFRDRWTFDCGARRLKAETSEAFLQNNLQGRSVQLDTSKEVFSAAPEETGDGWILSEVCSLGEMLKTADRNKAMPPPPADVGDETTLAWLKQHIDPGAYTLAYSGQGMGVYYDPTTMAKAESGRPLLWLRTELGVILGEDATARRSIRDQIELDCMGYRYMRLTTESYPGSNLLGPVASEAVDPVWTEVSAGSVSAKWMAGVCRSLAGGPAAAQPVPPPSTTNAQAAIDWAASYLNPNGYAIAGATPDGLLLYGTDDMFVGADGHLLVRMREEKFRTMPADRGGYRSSVIPTEIDCRSRSFRNLKMTGYLENNFAGTARDLPTVMGWIKPAAESYVGGLIPQICSQVSLLDDKVDRSLAMPTPLYNHSDKAIEAWIDDHIDEGDYVGSGYSQEAAAFYSATELERTRQDYIRVWTRLEFFKPTPVDSGTVRSMRMLMEFDCMEHRTRTLATESYPGANLLGTKTEQRKAEAGWDFIDPATLTSQLANDLCTLKDDVDEEQSDPAGALPTSAGRTAL